MDKNIFKDNNIFKNIKSKYILKQIFDLLLNSHKLEIIRYNNNIKNRLEIGLNDYKSELKIEIEIYPKKIIKQKTPNTFIKIFNKDDSSYHIYINNSPNETKNIYFTRKDKTAKVKVILDYEFNSFNGLFNKCNNIEKIKFIKFRRRDINNITLMFYGCSSLKEIDFSNFNTNNVIDMESMFHGCSALKELNLSNFNTQNVTNMRLMFSGCSSLKKKNVIINDVKILKEISYRLK